jgi:thiol-disulfide isomerase/thioredoxin
MSNNYYDNTKVTELKNKDFSKDKKLKISKMDFKGNYGIIKFYAPWCPHCKHMIDDLSYLANELDGWNVKIGAVNCENSSVGNDKLAQRAQVEGLPSLFLLREDGSLKKYDGDRNVDGMLSAIIKTAKKRGN